MSRRYPLDLPPDETPYRNGTASTVRESLPMRLAVAAADILYDLSEWRRNHGDLSRAIVGITLLILGFGLGSGAAVTDSYLHRGVESGADQPYIVQPTGKGLAANVDLRSRTEDQIVPVADALADGGFLYVRQHFSWSEIETSNDAFAWDEYDRIVNGLGRQRIRVIAVIVDTPAWARTIGDQSYDDAPPRSPGELEEFVATLTSRYMASVPLVQIGDRPNLASRWGGEPATAATFAPYLEAGWRGARAGNAGVHVLSPELASESDVPSGPSDLQFVQGLYDAGAQPYFDILGIVMDGGTYSPDDRRVEEARENFSRAILFRELMVDAGDSKTPIWATSFGWATSDAVTAEEQAEFVHRGMERSWSEWPWMGLMVHWAFLERSGSPELPYAILNNGSATPLWRRLTSSEVTERSQIANTGFAPMDSQSISDSGNWQNQHLEGRTFRTTRQVGSTITIEFQGTGLIAYVRSGPVVGNFTIHVDGKLVPGGGGDSGNEWDLSIFSSTDDFPRTLVQGLDDTKHTMTLTLVSEGELTLGGVEVVRTAPFVWPIILMTAGSLIFLFFGLRAIAYLLATRAGHLRRANDPDPGPQLPRMPSWRPERRVS